MTKTRALTFLIVLAGLLRIMAAVHQPVALDEAYAVHEAIFYRFPFTPSSPPLFPLFFRLWTAVSVRLLWIRLPQIVAGIAAVLFIWQIASRVSTRLAVIAGVLAATSALLVHYSWFARMYGMEILLVTLSLSLSVRAADLMAKNKFPDRKLLVLLTAVHTAGSLIAYGFLAYLMTLFPAFIAWMTASKKWTLIGKNRGTVFMVTGFHAALIAALTLYASTHAAEIRTEAAWIPAFSLSGFSGLLATLANMSGVITGAPIPFPFSILFLTVFAGFTALSYVAVPKSLAFVRYLLPIGTIAALFSSYLTPSGIPRTFLFLHVILIIVAACSTEFLIRARSVPIAMLLLFAYGTGNVRSYAAYNIRPYYNNPAALRLVSTYRTRSGQVAVEPPLMLPVIEYAWGFRRQDTGRIVPVGSVSTLPFTLFHASTLPLSAAERRIVEPARCSADTRYAIVIYYCQ